jgi:energy-coupling factor transporter ATP-binding protein EcfA2
MRQLSHNGYAGINRMKSALRDFSSGNLREKLPRDALPLFNKLVFEPDNVTVADIISFKKQFAFDDVWIFHGIAMEREGKAIVVSGPPGIGKSTLLRKFVRINIARPVDDGFILIGRTNGCYYIVESGLYVTLRTISVLSKWLRILTGYESPFLSSDCPHDMEQAIRRGQFLHNIAFLIGSLVNKNRSSVKVTSRPVRLVKLLMVKHERDSHPPKRIIGDRIESVGASATEKIFSEYLSCEVYHSTALGLERILYNRLWESIR